MRKRKKLSTEICIRQKSDSNSILSAAEIIGSVVTFAMYAAGSVASGVTTSSCEISYVMYVASTEPRTCAADRRWWFRVGLVTVWGFGLGV